LRAAADAVVVDTTSRSVTDVVNEVVELFQAKVAETK
jgi:cytidylate kinase